MNIPTLSCDKYWFGFNVKERISKNITNLKPLMLSCDYSQKIQTTNKVAPKGKENVVIQ